MPIVIKELFASDPLSEALEKINFNFDQMILAGGGPPGPDGPQGPAGVPGPQGDRGDHWQVGDVAPTIDHGPGNGALLQNDLWTGSSGQVYYWNASSLNWVDTLVNLKGPKGDVGNTGGSYEWKLYLGGINTFRTPNMSSPGAVSNNWLPLGNQILVDTPDVNFITPIGGGKNSLLLGDIDWAKFNLNNFLGTKGAVVGTFPNHTPKLTLIQNSIDYVGFGGLAIGAYGMTSSTGPASSLSVFEGGLSNNLAGPAGPEGDGRNMFFAGIAIRQETVGIDAVLSHVFRARTNAIDFEIQAGDISQNLSNGKSPSIRISNTNSTIFRGINASITGENSDLIRSVIGPTYSRYRDPLYIGFNTIQSSVSNGASPPNLVGTTGLIQISNSSKLITNGNARIAGDLYVGMPSIATASILLGSGRSIDGASELNFYTNASANTTRNFLISRDLGRNGNASIQQIGSGHLNISTTNTATSGPFGVSQASGNITFSTKSIVSGGFGVVDSQKAIIKNNGNFGIGTNLDPQVKLHVASNAEIVRIQGSDTAWMSFHRTSAQRSGYIGYQTVDVSQLRIFNEENLGVVSIGTNNTDRMTIDFNGNVGIGTTAPIGSINNTLQLHNTSQTTGASANIAFTSSNEGAGYYLRRNVYAGNSPNFELAYSNTNYANAATQVPIISVKTSAAVGIGTTAPDSSLHVNGIIKSEIPFTGGMMIFSNDVGSSKLNPQILGTQAFMGRELTFASGNVTYPKFTGAVVKVTQDEYSSPDITVPSNVNYDIQTQNNLGNLTSRLNIVGHSGYVGIGTGTGKPEQKLHVVDGNFKLTRGSIIYDPRVINTQAGTFEIKPTNNFFGFGFKMVSDGINGGVNNRNFQLGTWNNSSAYNRILRIDESGNSEFSGKIIQGSLTNANTWWGISTSSAVESRQGFYSNLYYGTDLTPTTSVADWRSFNPNAAGMTIHHNDSPDTPWYTWYVADKTTGAPYQSVLNKLKAAMRIPTDSTKNEYGGIIMENGARIGPEGFMRSMISGVGRFSYKIKSWNGNLANGGGNFTINTNLNVHNNNISSYAASELSHYFKAQLAPGIVTNISKCSVIVAWGTDAEYDVVRRMSLRGRIIEENGLYYVVFMMNLLNGVAHGDWENRAYQFEINFIVTQFS